MRKLILLLMALVVSMSSCECRKEPPPMAVDQALQTPNIGSKLGTPSGKVRRTPRPTRPPEPTATRPSAVPTDFPSEVPIFEGSTLMKADAMANNAHNVIFSVQDSVANVTTFYRDKLTKEGFEITQEVTRGEHSFATYKKGDLLVNVTIANDARSPGQQIIAIMYETEKPLPFDEF